MRIFKAFLVGFILVDIPVMILITIFGLKYGFKDSFWTVWNYREQHAWTLIPSIVSVFFLWRYFRKREISA